MKSTRPSLVATTTSWFSSRKFAALPTISGEISSCS